MCFYKINVILSDLILILDIWNVIKHQLPMFLVDGAKDVYRAHIRSWWNVIKHHLPMFLVDGAKDVYRAHIRSWWYEYFEWCCKLFYDFNNLFFHGLSQVYYAFTIIHMLFLIFFYLLVEISCILAFKIHVYIFFIF